MIYEYDLAIPANTLATAPVSQEMPLARGIIHKIELSYPAGCNNMVLVALKRGLHQVSPLNTQGQHKSNFHTISFATWYEMLDLPYQLEAYGWSPGTTYSHTVTIRIGILPKEVLMPEDKATPILQKLNRWFFGRGV